ncbi:unnamed protein product [Rotaria sp. Silwood2]|nr:unnamed protein product [Rotaria sp. Silwood2]CAF4163004.1 unnamed protein product [Rotaria sp. Silwood2]
MSAAHGYRTGKFTYISYFILGSRRNLNSYSFLLIASARVESKSPKTTSNWSSTKSRSAQTSSRTQRAVSAFPTSHRSAAAYAQRNNRSQSSRSKNHCGPLHSAVPDSAELEPIRRPDYGSAKRTMTVFTNHFRVTFDNLTVNHYEIDIVFIDQDEKSRPARKRERCVVLNQVVQQEKNFPIVWYDEGKNLYTRKSLSHFTEPILTTCQIGDKMKKFEFIVRRFVRQENLQNLRKFINGETSIRPHDAIRIVETLFKQQARNDFICIRNQFYDGRQQLDDLTEWERSSKPLANPKMATVKPEDRYKKIIKLAGDRNFGTDLYLKELNIHVDTTNMMQVQGIF